MVEPIFIIVGIIHHSALPVQLRGVCCVYINICIFIFCAMQCCKIVLYYLYHVYIYIMLKHIFL